MKETGIQRLHQFLSCLDDKYDSLRREILKLGDDTTAEEAFGIIKQEEGRTAIWNPSVKPTTDSGEAEIGAAVGREESTGVVVPTGSQKATYDNDDTKMTIGPPIGGGWWPEAEEEAGAGAEVAKARCGNANEGKGFGILIPNTPLLPLLQNPPLIFSSITRSF
ncbi:hypothetical protein SASPL_108686 [Salvia splendens]|uniref:Uncharacterized protein n=1 Tax=Salvia splendens TaxID=180675 RepID=A0A8X8YFR7_SALSN|nr:hypothetical protein SASPL_108686 [Salvia splendens]